MTFFDDAEMESHCRQLVDTLNLPQGVTVEEMTEAVAASQGMKIYLNPLPSGTDPAISGAVFYRAEGYFVRYPADADEFYLRACIGHELGHILGRHLRMGQSAAGLSSTSAQPASAATIDYLKALMPDMHEAIDAWRQAFRCEYTGPAEREAEMIGTLLIQRTETRRRLGASRTTPAGPGAQDQVLNRFNHLLGSRRDRREPR